MSEPVKVQVQARQYGDPNGLELQCIDVALSAIEQMDAPAQRRAVEYLYSRFVGDPS